MASYGQVSYLKNLFKQRVVPPAFQGMAIDPLSTKEASELIKILLAQPEAAKAAVAVKAKKDLVPEGFYYYENTVYKVVTSASGNRYAKPLIDNNGKGSWGYAPEITPLLEMQHLISLSEAKILGKGYGFCIVCGRTLTDPESIANGIGPICANNFA